MAEKIATREAYGKALAALADKYPDLVCFDADLVTCGTTKFPMLVKISKSIATSTTLFQFL